MFLWTHVVKMKTSSRESLAHERATSPLFQASAFAFRSFPLLIHLPRPSPPWVINIIIIIIARTPFACFTLLSRWSPSLLVASHSHSSSLAFAPSGNKRHHHIVDDWANVTPALLRGRIDADQGLLWQNLTLVRLSKSYWLNLIRSSGV